jgi:lysozyme family protein
MNILYHLLGRLNPGFTEQVNTFMINPFVKYKGLELFATYENASGRAITEKSMRHATQYAADLIYRFPAKSENFWIGFRYNSVTSGVQGLAQNITINREVASAGWFLTKNIMLKLEYVNKV